MDSNRPFRILAVCTGNVCRSPLVERVLQANLDERSPGAFEIRSAGTSALVGRGMTTEIAEIVRANEGKDSAFVSRQLTARTLFDQDLVLALTREHRAKVLEVAPRLLRQTFTLREFGRMVRCVNAWPAPEFDFSGDTHDRWSRLVPMAASVRHQILRDPEEDDVVDPFRRDASVHDQMLAQILPAIETLSEFEGVSARS